jgi:FixJ family two-component response regulator
MAKNLSYAIEAFHYGAEAFLQLPATEQSLSDALGIFDKIKVNHQPQPERKRMKLTLLRQYNAFSSN